VVLHIVQLTGAQ